MQTNKKIWILEDDPQTRRVYHEIFDFRYRLDIFDSLQLLDSSLSRPEFQPDLVIANIESFEGAFPDFYIKLDSFSQRQVPFVVASSIDDLDVLRACFEKGALDY